MITQQELQKIIRYDPETGVAVWRIGHRIGKRIGHIIVGACIRNKPYRYWSNKGFGRKNKPFSHVVFFYMTGRWPADEMDHINRDTLDDRWVNLREATRFQNEANKRAANSNSKTGFRGVRPIRGRYQANIYRYGERRVLGYFDTPQEASAVYLRAAAEVDGRFFRPS